MEHNINSDKQQQQAKIDFARFIMLSNFFNSSETGADLYNPQSTQSNSEIAAPPNALQEYEDYEGQYFYLCSDCGKETVYSRKPGIDYLFPHCLSQECLTTYIDQYTQDNIQL